jgi:pyruvate dehydrogenase E2 component (dihydrolipoamide acetyltransferase)
MLLTHHRPDWPGRYPGHGHPKNNNPGEAAILCFGGVRQMPWVVKGKIKPRWVTQLDLSFDHRMVNGDLGSRFLADVVAILHDPAQALVWG